MCRLSDNKLAELLLGDWCLGVDVSELGLNLLAPAIEVDWRADGVGGTATRHMVSLGSFGSNTLTRSYIARLNLLS